jgi:hypothetical protein
MAEALEVFGTLSADVTRLSAKVSAREKNVPAGHCQALVSGIARAYFETVHPELKAVAERAALVEEIGAVLQTLLGFAGKACEKDAYLVQIAELTRLFLEAHIALMKAAGNKRLVLSLTEKTILDTLTKMLPISAAAYEQTLRDIAQDDKVSWRGTASEIREVLREVIDQVAPDAEVMAAPGFKLEKDRTKPTQAQKVRYILQARKKSQPQIAVAAQSLDTADELVANLARRTYTRGAAATHAKADAKEIRALKRYVEPLLCELLAIN